MEQELKILINDGKNVAKTWKKNLWLVIIIGILGFIIGCVLTLYPNPDQYTATTTIYSYSLNDSEMKAVSQLIKTSRICQKAAEVINDDYINAEKIKRMIDVRYQTNSLIISISAYSESSEEAVIVANSIANAFINDINNIKGNNTINILDKAGSSYVYSYGTVRQWLLRGTLSILFVIITMVILAVRSLVAKDIIVTDDFSCGGKLQILGIIPKYYSR